MDPHTPDRFDFLLCLALNFEGHHLVAMSRLPRGARVQRQSAGSVCDVRLQRDFDELLPGGSFSLSFPNPTDPKLFIVRISPETGFWRGGKFNFEFTIPGS
jgi:ubiquitin-conjugating enzyme E2 M